MNRFFRFAGFAEGTSFLLLLGVAMPLKYIAGMPLAVKYAGWAHGVLFMAYIASAFAVSDKENWPVRKLAGACLASVLPFGPFVFDRKAMASNS
jgi:integral membrane protein